jgi:glycosyltransferase involved in cell wall biosynthesis
MKVLYLTKYSRNAASSRLRSFQYFSELEESGIEITVKPFFDDNYLDRLYRKQPQNPISILGYYFFRFLVLFSVFGYDKIVIEKELFPYFFSWFEKILKLLGIKYIVDYDDAIFHNYDMSKSKIISLLLKRKIDNVMKYSYCVIAGNSYLAERATNAGAVKVVILPTVIDLNRYEVKKGYGSEQPVIGWIGSPTSFKYISKLMPVLNQLIDKYNCKLQIVGAQTDLKFSKNVEFIPWTESSEVSNIKMFDIGIMPLENTPWELGKCSYKLIQYMGCGIPVVASLVGMNRKVVEDGLNGFLVSTSEEWFQAIEKLITNENLRKKLGEAGREKVESFYNLEKQSKLLISVLNG